MAIYSLGSPPQQLSQPLAINPEHNEFEVDVRAQLDSPLPMEVRAWVEWGAGRSFPVSIWPRRHGGSALDRVPYAPWTSVVALVVAWIAVPAAWRRLRHARRQFTVARLPLPACARALSSRSAAFAGYALSVVVALTTALPATAQEGPYAGLPDGVVRVAEAIRAGGIDGILQALPKNGEVVRTAYPGSGASVSLDTARPEIRELVVSDSSRSDSFGGGSYTLVAIWIPAVTPAKTLLVGSGIDSDGTRVSTAFTVESVGGGHAITAYGRILDLRATLQQFEGQGDLRRVAPGPPATGSAGLAATHMASAQDGSLPCPGMMNVVDDNFDTTLQLTGRAEVTARNAPAEDERQTSSDVVTLSWSVKAGSAKCIWIQRKGPGEADYPSFAIFVLRPDQTSRVDRPGGNAGEYCYRIFAVSDAGRSQPVESCVNITTPRRLVVFDGPAPGAPDAGAGTARGQSAQSGFLWLGAGAVMAGLVLLGFPTARWIARR